MYSLTLCVSVSVIPVPGQPSVTVDSTTATIISLSWSVPSDSEVDSYEVMWQRDTSGCPGDDEGSMSVTTTDISTSLTITVQQEDSSYSITVTAVNAAGNSAPSNAVTAVIGEAGYYFLPLSTVFQKLYLCFYLPAPSAAPISVSVSEMTSSSITVQWGAVNCIHHNGDITGYSVRYGVQGSGEGDRTVEMSSGDSSGGMYQISGLSAATLYTIEVAAVNNAGTGVYSTPITIEIGRISNCE